MDINEPALRRVIRQELLALREGIPGVGPGRSGPMTPEELASFVGAVRGLNPARLVEVEARYASLDEAALEGQYTAALDAGDDEQDDLIIALALRGSAAP